MQVVKGKVAVVTGAGSGIGRALAIALAAEGCNLALADINSESLKETQRLLDSNVFESNVYITYSGCQSMGADADVCRQCFRATSSSPYADQ